jgi:lysophospholipase L1-like esterase
MNYPRPLRFAGHLAVALAVLPAFGQNTSTGSAAANSAPARPARAATPHVAGIQADSTVSAYKFYFGAGDAPAGYTKITPETAYTGALGYGFDRPIFLNPNYNPRDPQSSIVDTSPSNIKVTAVAGANGTGGAVTSDPVFYFSTALPEGNYKVTATLGNPGTSTDVSVLAENRRLMLENVQTKPNEYVTKSFIVNIRRPEYPGGAVRLKGAREAVQEAWDWDKGLTLEFIGDHPSLASLQIERVDVPTVFIVGDSTSCDQMVEPFNSWGQSITRFFKPDIAVANHGESGETYGSSLSAHRFDKVWSLMKPGDYLLVQFGHNDMKNQPNTDQYTANIQKVVDGTKKTGGTLVIITPMNRHSFDANGNVTNSLQGYPHAAYEVADKNKVAWIELNAMSKTLYESFGKDGSEVLFAQTGPTSHDGTHHSDFGSYELAKCIILGIQQDKLPLAAHVVDGFTFDPAHPDKLADFKVVPTPKPTAGMDKPPGS